MGIAFSPDGRRLLVAYHLYLEKQPRAVEQLRVWDTRSWKCVAKPTFMLPGEREPCSVQDVAFSSDGKLIAALRLDERVKLWDANSLKELQTVQVEPKLTTELREGAQCFAFTPDSKRFAVGFHNVRKVGEPGEIRVFETSTGKCLMARTGHVRGVSSLAFSSDGRHLASAGRNKVIIWDCKDWHREMQSDVSDPCHVMFSPDGKQLVVSTMDRLRLWDLAKGQWVSERETDMSAIYVLAWSPDGKCIATAHCHPVVVLWDAATLKPTQTFTKPALAMTSLAFSPDSSVLAAAGCSDRIWFFPVPRVK